MKQQNKNLKFLVHIHVYYHNQVDYMIEKLSNISNCDWDLYVTLNEENQETTQKFLQLNPNTKFVKTENKGYDVWPFIQTIRSLNLDDYDYILKIHTKAPRNKSWGCHGLKYDTKHFRGNFWRDRIIDAIVGSKELFQANIKKLQSGKSIGMITSRGFFIPIIDEDFETDSQYKLYERLNIKKEFRFVSAGTMFIIKADVVKKLANSDIKAEDFDNKSSSRSNGTIAHAIERIFATLVNDAGYKVHKVGDWDLEFKHYFSLILKNIFSIENTLDKKYKILTILGIKIKFKKK